MAISLMLKSVLVMAISVMMTGIGHAGPTYNPFLTGDSVSPEISGYTVYNRSQNNSNDNWNSNIDGFWGDDYTGFYLGTFAGNISNKKSILPLINYFLKGYTFSENEMDWVKFENLEKDTNSKTTDGFTTTVIVNSDKKSGSWSVEKSNQEQTISFYTVKGSNEFALYYVDPYNPTGTGSWTTRHLLTGKEGKKNRNQPGISNFTTIMVPSTPADNHAAPEPATMLLFGFGLIGLAGMARLRNSKF